MNALVSVAPPDAVLSCGVFNRGDALVPRLAIYYPSGRPPLRSLRAQRHALAAMVESASPDGARWDLRLVEGEDRGVTFMGVELALDRATYAAAREGELVLSRVVEEMEATR